MRSTTPLYHRARMGAGRGKPRRPPGIFRAGGPSPGLMRWLDREIPRTGGRSVRELVILAGGVALSIWEVTRAGGPDLGNLLVYAGATLLFALRFYLARAVAAGACVGAIVQQWPYLRYGLGQADAETLAVFPVLALGLLASRDLVGRFEGAPSQLRLLPNPWAAFTSAETRTLRWACYAAGALAGLLDHSLQLTRWADPALWPRVAMVSLCASLVALGLGRAIGLLGVWSTGVAVALAVAPQVMPAESAIAGDSLAASGILFGGGPHYVLPIFALALAAAMISTRDAVRLIGLVRR